MALTKITSTNIQPGAIESSSLETSGATAGTYGAAAKIPVLSVNAQGIVYAITEADVAGVTDFTYNSSTEVLTISTADGSTFNADISTLASQTYVDTAESDAVTTANAYTDTRESAITTAYQAYADQAELDAVATANAYTDQEVAALVDSSPAALDTLNELAAALGDDPNFATTVSTNIGTKADKTTTITAGTGLSGGGDLSANRSIAISNTGVTAGSYGTSTAIPVITVNAQGQITSASTTAITVGDGTLTVNSGTGLSGSGTFTANQTSNGTITLSHADTSSQASVNNSGANVIQDVTLDGFGHVTGLGSVDLSTQFLGINAKAADSDTLDGLNSTQFLRSDATDTFTGQYLSLNSTGYLRTDNSGYFTAQSGGSGFQFYNSGYNTVRMHISDAGNVGIGTTSPSSKLQVNGSLTIESTGQLNVRYDSSDSYRSTLDWNYLQLGNNGGNSIVAGRTNTGGYLRFFVNNTNDVSSGINGTEAMRIHNSGRISMGAAYTGTTGWLSVSSGSAYPQYLQSTQRYMLGMRNTSVDTNYIWLTHDTRNSQSSMAIHFNGIADRFYFEENGDFTAAGDVVANSDIRLKSNISTINNALDKVLNLRGVEFTKHSENNKVKHIGVIAQEVESVVPEVVSTADDKDNTKSVAYGNMVALLIEAVKEQQEQIDELKRMLENK